MISPVTIRVSRGTDVRGKMNDMNLEARNEGKHVKVNRVGIEEGV